MSKSYIYRDLRKDLLEWKKQVKRKPLIIRGARQVGKTTLIKDFAQSYKHRILLNLEKSRDRSFFEGSDDVKSIKEALFISNNIVEDKPGTTLLFLDEIQESPQAIKLLRYFYEEEPSLHVIAAGSLFEFAMNNIKSFPVGRVSFLYLHPLNFREFINALGKDQLLNALDTVPMNPVLHDVVTSLFKEYAIIGGMPEVVKQYVDNQSKIGLEPIYESIWSTYKEDVKKYGKNDTQKKITQHILETAHLYLDQRIKFNNFGNSNYKSREVGQAFSNLDAAKVIRLIYPTLDVAPPAKPDLKKAPRMQFLDTGIVNYTLGIQGDLAKLNDMSAWFRGALISHLITQELISLEVTSPSKPVFWVRQKAHSSSEVDLIYSYQNMLIPIEIKSGSTGRLRSLFEFMKRSPHKYAVRISENRFKIEEIKTIEGKKFWLMNLPLYLGTKIHDYISFFVDQYSEEKI